MGILWVVLIVGIIYSANRSLERESSRASPSYAAAQLSPFLPSPRDYLPLHHSPAPANHPPIFLPHVPNAK